MRAPVVRGQQPWQERTTSTGLGHRPSGRSDLPSLCTPSLAAPQPKRAAKNMKS
jgi:hypothetical protein